MPKLNTRPELALKIKLSKQRVRTLQKDIRREHERQAKLKAKMRHAPE